MGDWCAVLIALALFVVLTPGLLFQIPGRERFIEVGTMQTSGKCILVHTIIFFILITILLIAIVVHFHPVPDGGGGEVPDSSWKRAVATWYGDPEGDGSNGGACGYGTLVDVQPLKAQVTAVSSILFDNGEGCGACYLVKCLDGRICSTSAVNVIVTDECPGCSGTHFDLSGAAFGRMAFIGEGGQLRNQGVLPIVYRRTPCEYPGTEISFRVNEGSSAYWLSLLVVFEGGDGDIGAMYIKPATSNGWMPMAHLWGANWYISGQGALYGPFSVQLTTLSTKKTLTASNVIPRDFAAGATYTFHLNI